MKFACVNLIQNFQRKIFSVLEQVEILNIKIFLFSLLHMQTEERRLVNKTTIESLFFSFVCLLYVETMWNAVLFHFWRVSCTILSVTLPLAALDFGNCAAEGIRLSQVS